LPQQYKGDKMNNFDAVIEIEEGNDFDKQVEAMQELINSGQCWHLQGSYGRAAMDMIKQGYCMLGETGHKDYYGNYVPSKYEVQAGTKGSKEFVEAKRKERENS